MLNSEKEFLVLFGWDDFFRSQIPDLDFNSMVPARVICEERNLYRLQVGVDLVLWAGVSGKMQYSAISRVDFPAVGDWVLLDIPKQSERGVIRKVLNRKTMIQRRQVGGSADLQILSTNVDYAFITTSVNSDLSFRRIERYLAIAWEAKVTPIILLTKADMSFKDIEIVKKEVQNEFPSVQVFSITQNNFEEAEYLPKLLKEGSTSVFVGSSGVGKSTLVNFLIGKDVIATQEIREDDEKGRHTTTSRNLYVSRFGGLVIDTPGMRELQLSDHSEGVSTQFSDIERLVGQCRFTDCQHQTEPNCAIKQALAFETITFERWQSYQKLEAEVRHGERKQNKAMEVADKKMWKKRSKEVRDKGRFKKAFL